MRTLVVATLIFLFAGPIAEAARDPPYHMFVTRKGWEIASWLGEPPGPDMQTYLFIDTPGKLYFGVHRTAAAQLEPEYATFHFNSSGLDLVNVTLTLPITDAAHTGWIYTSIDVAPQPEERGTFTDETVFHMRNADGTLTSQTVNLQLAGSYAVIQDPRDPAPPPPKDVVISDVEPVQEERPFPWLWIILAVAVASLVAAMLLSRRRKDGTTKARR